MMEEMTPECIRAEVAAEYPALPAFIEAAVESLYAAVWFGHMMRPLLAVESATALYLRSPEWQPEAASDVARLTVLASLVGFAADDAAYEAHVSGAYEELAEAGRKAGLEKPAVPVEWLQDLFANVGAEVLAMRLGDGGSHPAAVALTQAILWANGLKQESERHGGRLTAESNAVAVEKLLAGLRALCDLGGLQ